MIERNEDVPPEYTDEHLTKWSTGGAGQAEYARTMLAVPPEYRQGVALRARAIRTGVAARYVGWDEAYRMAAGELCAQGVTVGEV